MNGIEELLKKYGTSLEETRKLMPELVESIKREREAMMPPALPTTPQFFTAEEVRGMGLVTEAGEPFELELGWRLKVTPPVDGQEPMISYITPEEWEITQDQIYISPIGERFTREQIEAQLAAPEVPLEVEQVFGRVFPERDVVEVLAYAEAQPELFYRDIRDIGRTPETETFLKTIFPEITPEQIDELFGPVRVPVPTREEFWAVYPGEPYPYEEEPTEPTLPPIPPEGIIYTVEDERGEQIELHILEDFEYVGTERTLVSPDYPVYHGKTQIGTFIRETGEFVPRDWTWWEKTLGIGVKTLEWVFYIPNVVGMMTRDIWERFKIWPWLPQEERERLHAELTAKVERLAETEGIRQILPGGSKYEEFRQLPWYQQLAFESPFWIALGALGLSAIKGRAALIPAATRPGFLSLPAKITRAGLYPLAEVETLIGYLPSKAWQQISKMRWNKAQLAGWVKLDVQVQKLVVQQIDDVLRANPHLAQRATPETISKIAYGMSDILKAGPQFAKTLGPKYGLTGVFPSEALGSEYAKQLVRSYARFALEWAMPAKSGATVQLLTNVGFSSDAIAKMSIEVAWSNLVAKLGVVGAAASLIKAYEPPVAGITDDFITSLAPKGSDKIESLIAQLKEAGYSSAAIADMTPEQAQANLLKRPPEPPPEVFIEIPRQEDIIQSALEVNWGKTLAQKVAKIPVVGEALIKGIDPRELVSMDATTIEALVTREAIGFAEVVKMGQNAAAVKMGELQGITTNPVKMFGFNKDAYSAKMISRLLPDYKGTVEAGTLEHVFTHPEMYSWEGFDKGLRYVTTVHEINTQVFNLLKKEGVAPNLSEEAMREWWIHRVVEGRYDADGELIAIRGRPGMRGVTAAKRGYEMHRKAPTMFEGMSWHIKYAENPEVSVRTYIEDAFIKMAQERFYQGTDTALEAIGKAGVKPGDVLKELYPDIVGRFELAADELKAAANFHSVISRAIRGERIPEQTLRAIDRRFPELGKRFRALVKEPAVAEKQLRAILDQNEKLIKSLRAKLEKAEAIDIEAIKAEARAEAVRTGIPDEQKLVEAFRIMDYGDRLAFRSTMESQMDDIGRMLAEEETELAGILEFLKTDPVAIYHGTVRGKRVPLTSVLVKGQFPESFTVAQATMLMMGKKPVTVIKGRVPRSVVIDELADHFKMSEQQLIDHIEHIAVQRVTAKDLRTLVTFGSNRQQGIKRMLEILDRVDTAPQYIPKAEPGMPEAGMQQDMFGYETPHFPAGKGKVTQISMDDYNKLVEYHKQQGLPPPDVGIRPVVEGIKGLEPEAVPTVPEVIKPARLYFTLKKAQDAVRVIPKNLTDEQLQKHIVKLRDYKGYIDRSDMPRLIEGGYFVGVTDPSATGVVPKDPWLQTNLGQALDEAIAERGRRVVKPPAVEAQFKQVTYEAPPVKSVAERKVALDALRKEVKLLTEAKKVPYWKARAERAAKMELVRQPPIGEGFIMQSHFSGKIYDQEFIDAVNAFFGHKSGLKILKPIADLSGILTTAKAALDVSFPAIQGLPAFGLAHSYFLTNPKIGAKLLGAWFRAFAYPVRAYLQPEWMHRIVAKNEADALQRISFGGSSMSIDYFRALRARGGLGGFAAEIMHKIPFSPYERAELAFYGAGEIIRNEFWNILKGDAIRQGSEFNLAQSLDRMTGLISTEKMGITLTQRQLERSFLFFAPQYTRACLTFLGNVFRGGYTGAQARRSLGGLIAAGAIYYAAVQYAIATLEGKDHDDAWDTVLEGYGLVKDPITGDWEWKPTARFMSFRIGNYNFGVGGFWYGLVRLSGNINACINEVGERERIDLVRIFKNGSFNRRDNPFIYWWWSRSSMVTHGIAELGTGTDFLGYPIETPWEYSRHLISMLEPIWMEQGVNWMIPGMARDNEIPEGVAREAIIPAELFGLRTFPEGQWVRFYDKASEYIKHIPEDELDEKQIEAWRDGKLEWRHLTDIQQINLLSRYPELNDIYTAAQADSAVRDSGKWKQWTGRTDEERATYYDRGDNLVQRLQVAELDTREFREMWSEAGQNYGIALDTIEKEPTYSEIYDYFEKAQSERGEKYGFMDDLALGEYIEIMFTDYLDEKGDYDWDAKDIAVDEYIERWGEETYERIRQMYADKKLLAGLSPVLIRLSDDKDALGREYWQLPYKPIKEMDEDDEVEGNIPAEYFALWKQYQALETDAQRDAFIETNPILAKDWRADYRKDHPEDDARLALWGYGGKLQSMEAYDLVTKWAQELGIPLEQMGLGLPPRSLIDQYFEHAEIVKETSGSSVDARLYKLEHPGWLDWGVENWGWGDLSDDNITALRFRVEHKDLFTQYENYGDRHSELYIEDDKARQKARDKLLEENPIFRDDRRRVEAYQLEFPDEQIENYVEYSNLPAKGFEQERYLLEHPEFYKSMIDLKDIVPFDPGYKVPAVQYDQIYHKWEDLFEQYDSVTGTVSQRKVAREKILTANPEFAFDRQRREAYGNFVPEHLVDTYAEWFTTKPQRSDDLWFEEHPTQTYYGDDWWLMDRIEFYNTMVAMGLWEERDFSKVPTKEVFALYKTYLGIPKGAPQLNYRARFPELDAWGVLKFGWIPIGQRGKKEPPKTPWEEAEEAKRFKELF